MVAEICYRHDGYMRDIRNFTRAFTARFVGQTQWVVKRSVYSTDRARRFWDRFLMMSSRGYIQYLIYIVTSHAGRIN